MTTSIIIGILTFICGVLLQKTITLYLTLSSVESDLKQNLVVDLDTIKIDKEYYGKFPVYKISGIVAVVVTVLTLIF